MFGVYNQNENKEIKVNRFNFLDLLKTSKSINKL